jgi:hypothetical protein
MPIDCETKSEETLPTKSPAEKWEGIAFTFCKAATIVLLITLLHGGRFMLPIIAGVACLLYLVTYFSGKKKTRCNISHPLLVAALWAFISGFSLWIILR